MTTSECINMLGRKHCVGNIAIKFDIKKAFDTLTWIFILGVLRQYGFHPTFIARVHSVLKSVKISILLNGYPHSFFHCSRGVRYGDLLFPILFYQAEDVLSRGITKLF